MGVGSVFDYLAKGALAYYVNGVGVETELDADVVASLDQSKAYDVSEVVTLGRKVFQQYCRAGLLKVLVDKLLAVKASGGQWSAAGNDRRLVRIADRDVWLTGKTDLWYQWGPNADISVGALDGQILDWKVSGILKPGSKKPCTGWTYGFDSLGGRLNPEGVPFSPGKWDEEWISQQWIYSLITPFWDGGSRGYSIEQCCWPWWYTYHWSSVDLDSRFSKVVERAQDRLIGVVDAELSGWDAVLGEARRAELDLLAQSYGYLALEML